MKYLILIVYSVLLLNLCQAIEIQLVRRNSSHPIQDIEKRGTGESISLQGGLSSLGEFYAPISIGSSSQQFLVQVDTGSTDLLLYGSGCSGCGSVSNYYSLSSSSNIYPCSGGGLRCSSCVPVCSTDACAFRDGYASGAVVQGYIINDLFTIGNFPAARVPVGFISSVSGGSFETAPIEGIWGLAYSPLSSWGGDSVLTSLIASNGLQNIFSMCLADNNPKMFIGVDYTNVPGTQWTPIIEQAWYTINVLDMKLNGNSLGVSSSAYNPSPSIVDSGTTLFLLPPQPYNAFQNSLLNIASQGYLRGISDASSGKTLFDGWCYTMSSSDISAFPTISIELTGSVSLSLSGSQYLYLISGQYYCLGLAQGGTGTVLGDVVMKNYHVIFDKQNLRVGFAPLSSCGSGVSNNEAVVQSSSFHKIVPSIVTLTLAIFLLFF